MAKGKKKSWRIRGAEWVVTGAAVLIATFVLPWAAPAALTFYGLYRWIVTRNYGQGISMIAVSFIAWVLLMGPLSGIFWPIKILGTCLIGAGVVMMVLPQKKPAIDDSEAVIEIQNDHNEN